MWRSQVNSPTPAPPGLPAAAEHAAGQDPLCQGPAGGLRPGAGSLKACARWQVAGYGQQVQRACAPLGPETLQQTQGQREQPCQHVWRLSWAGMPREYGAPSCPPERGLWGIHRHGWESEAGHIPPAPPGPSPLVCTPHSLPWAPISGPPLKGHCYERPPGKGRGQPTARGNRKRREGVAAIFKPTKGKRNAS